MRIDVVVYPGFDELDAFGPYEVFGHAAEAGADVDLGYAALGGPGPVTAAHGTTVIAHREVAAAGLVVVPGGGWSDGARPGARAEAASGALGAALVALHDAGTTVASVCTGAMILASAGMLDGLSATTHHTAIDQLPDYGATPLRERVVDSGSIVTAGGVTSGIDLALHLVERLFGPAPAAAAATTMEHTRIPAHHPPSVI